MRHDELWQHIHTERAALAGHLASLSPDDWEQDSLCPGWTVLDVAAHVISNPQVGGREVLGMLGRNLGRGYNAMIFREVKRRSRDQTPERILADFERYAASTRHVPLTTSVEPLLDVIVHSQDIALPLGRTVEAPVEATRRGLDRVWELGWPFRARQRLSGLHLRATDTDWQRGEGPAVEGPALGLLLLLTGRTATAAPLLSGSGVASLPAT